MLHSDSKISRLMPPYVVWTIVAIAAHVAATALLVAGMAHAQTMTMQSAAAPYPNMAPIEQYRIDKADEIALARSAAPASISDNADVLVLGDHGYEKAVTGKNGFVCIVERSWANTLDNAEFWNSKLRSPICFSEAAARTVLPEYLQRTEWVLSGVSLAEMDKRTRAEIASGEIGPPAPTAMCYMMSKSQNLNDTDHAWYPHLMFFLPRTPAEAWGANQPGTLVVLPPDSIEPVSTFMVLVPRWSDKTPSPILAPKT